MGRGLPTRRAFVSGALGTAGIGLAGIGSATASRGPSGARTSASQRFGAYVPDPYWDWSGWPGALNAFTDRAGEAPSILSWYACWAGQPAFPVATARLAASRGALPLLTWEPWDWSGGAEQSGYQLARITAGAFDGYLRSFAGQVKAYGAVVYLRFAPEMNGDWNTWSERVNGNRPGDYVRAWNHVRAVFTSVGVANVRWVWTPIVNHSGSAPLPGLFPGASAVDVVGLDGFNWGRTLSTSVWQSFTQVFGSSLTQVRSLSTKPLWLAEVGCSVEGGDKAAWVTDMFAQVRADARIDALVWFNADKETDWRINSSAAVKRAFRTGLQDGRFVPAG